MHECTKWSKWDLNIPRYLLSVEVIDIMFV